MLVQLFLKAVFIYFGFVLIKNVWKGYKTVQTIKEGMAQAQGASAGAYGHGARPHSSTQNNGDVVEAEFRVINEQDS